MFKNKNKDRQTIDDWIDGVFGIMSKNNRYYKPFKQAVDKIKSEKTQNKLERILIRFGIIKDKRFDGKRISWQEFDECGHLSDNTVTARWNINKKYISGCDPY
jgi:hypothetical protein